MNENKEKKPFSLSFMSVSTHIVLVRKLLPFIFVNIESLRHQKCLCLLFFLLEWIDTVPQTIVQLKKSFGRAWNGFEAFWWGKLIVKFEIANFLQFKIKNFWIKLQKVETSICRNSKKSNLNVNFMLFVLQTGSNRDCFHILRT